MHRLAELKHAAASMLFPNHCPFCDCIIGPLDYWCESCYDELPFLKKHPPCPNGVDGMYSCCGYSGKVTEAVHRMKNGRYAYALGSFAVLMTEAAGDIAADIDIVTSVPGSLKRRLELGYDHTSSMAREIAFRRRLRFVRLLRKVSSGSEQKTLTRKERFLNAEGAYKVRNPRAVKGKSILLIDDICTSGATLSSAARQLKAAGAAKVYALTFAQTELK